MKFLVFLLAHSLLACEVGFTDDVQTCWQSLLEIKPSISSDMSCVLKTSKKIFEEFCSDDGVSPSQAFKTYLLQRSHYQDAAAEAHYLKPDSPSYRQTASKVENAWQAWKRGPFEEKMATLLQTSGSCK